MGAGGVGGRPGVVGAEREVALTAASEDLKVRNGSREERWVLLPEQPRVALCLQANGSQLYMSAHNPHLSQCPEACTFSE